MIAGIVNIVCRGPRDFACSLRIDDMGLCTRRELLYLTAIHAAQQRPRIWLLLSMLICAHEGQPLAPLYRQFRGQAQPPHGVVYGARLPCVWRGEAAGASAAHLN